MKATATGVLAAETRCNCWKVERTDGTVLGFTDHDVDVVYGGVTYQAAAGMSGSAARQTSEVAKDNSDIFGIFDSAAITDDDLAAGLYEGATVSHFQLDYTNTGAGIHKLGYGLIGEVTRSRDGYSATVYGMDSLLSQTLGRRYSRTCSWTLGDTNCGIELLPDDWAASTAYAVGDAVKATSYDGRRYVCTTAGTSNDTEGEPTWDTTVGNTTTETDGVVWTCYEAYTKQGTVTGVTSRQVFQDTGRSEDADDFNWGWVTFTSGDNDGLTRSVKDYAADGTFTLLQPFPFDIATSDTYTAVRGCNKILKAPGDVAGTAYTGDCRAKFNLENGGNALNFGGFPELPGDDKLLSGP